MKAVLEGKAFRDRPYRICAEKVAEFVAVTGDDPSRWDEAAPPGFAAALLFVVAPELLAEPAVQGSVIHADQTFTWHRPLAIEGRLSVTGIVERVRERGGTAFVVFSLQASGPDGPVVEGRSTFLVGESGLDAGDMVVSQPGPDERADSASVDRTLPSPRSASRTDLIRYAAATRDWNPIHWDHETAVEAGLG
ncbi:MAG: MaoC/PaaZ C-terminal domain-containing protein, partial [Actinomycetota bacterium]